MQPMIIPTRKYLREKNGISWEKVKLTILNPNKIIVPNMKNRLFYYKRFNKYVIEVHGYLRDDKIFVVNASKNKLLCCL